LELGPAKVWQFMQLAERSVLVTRARKKEDGGGKKEDGGRKKKHGDG